MSKNKNETSLTLCVLKGIVVGLVVSLMLTLILALLTSFTEIDDKYVNIIQVVIKQIAVVIATFIAVTKEHCGWLTGLLSGVFFSTIAFIVYSLIGGEFVFDQALGLNIVFSCIIGTVSGIISVNIKK
ncbi:MAG: TIGR04086 family membrane protein [Clostridia bacterium]